MSDGVRIQDIFGPEGPGDVPPEHFHWEDCHHGHHHHHDHHHGHHHHHDHHVHFADECDDQLPAISKVGRGIQGDDFFIKISDPDTCTETYLEGWKHDNVSGVTSRKWVSKNINGGELYYQYQLRPFTSPQTFTITFIYRRPGRCEWSWTTPAIPYIWDANGDGQPDVDDIIGSGIATLYVKTVEEQIWKEKLVYPDGTGPLDYNTPSPLEAWTSNIIFGYGGDVEVPTFPQLDKILGVPDGTCINILNDVKNAFAGSDNVKDYIDDLWEQFLSHVEGNPTIDREHGKIIWPSDNAKVARGNMNIYSGETKANWIKTREKDYGENDMWGQ